jgi:hypothetical protein
MCSSMAPVETLYRKFAYLNGRLKFGSGEERRDVELWGQQDLDKTSKNVVERRHEFGTLVRKPVGGQL